MSRARTTPRRRHPRSVPVDPAPGALHSRPTAAGIARSRVALVICVALWLLYMTTVVVTLSRGGALVDVWHLLGTALFLISVTMLTFSASMYLLARVGALPRLAAHRRARRADIDEGFDHDDVRVLALLPSYGEDPAYVRMALWSVALQEAPHLRVVLLLDDPPGDDPALRDRVARTRAIADEIRLELAAPRECAQDAVTRARTLPAPEARRVVAEAYATVARWARECATAEPRDGHVETFFAEQVLGSLADDLGSVADALGEAGDVDEEILSSTRVQSLARRLTRILGAEIEVFERKRFPSLSHEPTKAANLNVYLALVGGVHQLRDLDGIEHVVDVPVCDAVITLDADSMLLPGYCMRLIHALEQPENAGVAVIQTPYSAYRGAPTRLERLAGATTDLQHIVHQGLTAFDATFWVGANAILRWEAVRSLRRESREDGIRVVRFISDRTAIEDTESSIDIAAHGWSLLNYPERLSYSATPPDFGTLVIQRRRWADGGLLVLPRLHALALQRRREGRPLGLAQRLLRMNYLGSVSWVTLGLLAVLTLYPMDGQLVTLLLLLIAVPYFTEMASDLHALGYHRRDVAAIYGLNLLLLPVNLAGSAASLVQVLSGRRARFARTPKVSTRTRVPALYLLAPLAIAGIAIAVAVRSVFTQAWGTTVFAAFTALAILWAITRLIGIRHTVSDLWFAWLDWIWVTPVVPTPAPDLGRARWAAVLDDGPLDATGAVA